MVYYDQMEEPKDEDSIGAFDSEEIVDADLHEACCGHCDGSCAYDEESFFEEDEWGTDGYDPNDDDEIEELDLEDEDWDEELDEEE